MSGISINELFLVRKGSGKVLVRKGSGKVLVRKGSGKVLVRKGSRKSPGAKRFSNMSYMKRY